MKILLVQTSFLGDIVLSTPVIAGIKKIFPESELWLLTTPLGAKLLSGDPSIDGILEFDKHGKDRGVAKLFAMAGIIRGHGFDRAYILHRSFRTALLIALSRLPLTIAFKEARLSWLYSRTISRSGYPHDALRNLSILSQEAPLESFQNDLRLFPPKPECVSQICLPLSGSVVLVPSSAWATKMWKYEGYREVASYLCAKGEKVVVTGAAGEEITNHKVSQGLPVTDLTGKSSLADLLYIISQAKAVVCNDSMALHIASAFKIPTVVVFCATSPSFGFGPWKNKATIVEAKNVPCRPCSRHGTKVCPNLSERCMRDVSADEVIQALNSLVF